MENLRENASFNSRVIELRNAHLVGDTKTVRFLIDNFKAKKEYYDTVTVESLRSQLENIEERIFGANNFTQEERAEYNREIAELRQEIVEKKEFVKNEELVNEICAENFNNLVQEKSNRIIRNRRITTVAAVAAGVIIIALAAKGCSNKNSKTNTSDTIETINIMTSNGDEVTTDSTFEETAPIDYFDIAESGYSIDPVIGEPTTTNNYGSNNGTLSGTNGGTTTGPTMVNGTPSATPTPYIPNIPGVNNYTDVVITYNPDGHIEEITWPTSETTRVVPLPNTDPTGNDPLPVEPSHVVNPDTTPDRDPVITITPAPVPVITPAVPTGDVPGEQPTVYPTEPSQPVPTDASEPSAPTAAPTDPTSAPTLPDIPTWDLPDEEVTEYDLDGHVVSNTMTLRR